MVIQIFEIFKHETKKVVRPLYKNLIIQLAHFKRSRLDSTGFIGITGSSGKTTTKDLVYDLLKDDFITVKSDDTNNQTYSAARTILPVKKNTKYLVQEIGASATNDISMPLRLLRPNIGVITNVGLDHYSKFRNKEAVAAEKSKLIRCLSQTGTAILNADDPHVFAMAELTAARVFTYGFRDGCDLRARHVASCWPERLSMTLEYLGKSHDLQTQYCGSHFTTSILAALSTSLVSGVDIHTAISRVEKSSPTLGRMSPQYSAAGIIFIRDDWKAPFWSIQLPIEFMKQATAKRKIIVIGTISDIWGSGGAKYRTVAECALDAADIVYFYGPNSNRALTKARPIPDGKTLRVFKDFREIANHMKSELTKGDLVLLKGSGADHLARLSIMFDKELACWRQRCDRNQLCDGCRLVSNV